MKQGDWTAMIGELRQRGRGNRESGAFMLASRTGDRRTVTRVVYLDDLDPNCLTGGIEFDGRAYSKLWDICDAEQKVVVGDVHTHPSDWVQQSSIDAKNPMLAKPGHVALIVPHYASRPVAACAVGVHQYDGECWTSWLGQEAAQRLFIRRFL